MITITRKPRSLRGIPNFPDPDARYSDPYVSVEMLGRRAYPLIARLLVDPERVAFLRSFVASVALAAIESGHSAVTAIEMEDVSDDLKPAIEMLATQGLDAVEPDVVLRILKSPAALLEAFAQIDLSESSYWTERKAAPSLSVVPCILPPIERKRRRVLTYAIAATLLMSICLGAGGVATYRFLKPELDRLNEQIQRLGLNRVVMPDEPQDVFRIAGNNVLATDVYVNPAYIKMVRIRWGTEEDGRFSVEKEIPGNGPLVEADIVRISESSGPLKTTGGFQEITAEIQFEAHSEAASDPAVEPYLKGPIKRSFLLTPWGIVADFPGPLHVGRLTGIYSEAKEDDPTLYTVTGRANLRRGAKPLAYLIVHSVHSGQNWVTSQLEVAPESGDFTATCHIGPGALDGLTYELYIVVATSADAKELSGKELPAGVQWSTLGYARSEPQRKINDGKSGFATIESGD